MEGKKLGWGGVGGGPCPYGAYRDLVTLYIIEVRARALRRFFLQGAMGRGGGMEAVGRRGEEAGVARKILEEDQPPMSREIYLARQKEIFGTEVYDGAGS